MAYIAGQTVVDTWGECGVSGGDEERDDGEGSKMRRELPDKGPGVDEMLVVDARRGMMREELRQLESTWRAVLRFVSLLPH